MLNNQNVHFLWSYLVTLCLFNCNESIRLWLCRITTDDIKKSVDIVKRYMIKHTQIDFRHYFGLKFENLGGNSIQTLRHVSETEVSLLLFELSPETFLPLMILPGESSATLNSPSFLCLRQSRKFVSEAVPWKKYPGHLLFESISATF